MKFTEHSDKGRNILLNLKNDVRSDFLKYPRDLYDQTVQMSQEHVSVYCSLNDKANSLSFVKLSDEFKDLCYNLPQNKRNDFFKLKSEERDQCISLESKHQSDYVGWRYRNNFIKLSNDLKHLCWTFTNNIRDHFMEMTPE